MKDLKISKELFEAVRNYKINKISIYGSSKYFYVFDDYLPEHNKIGREESFNDFFFECKDWALKKFNIKIHSATFIYGGTAELEDPNTPSKILEPRFNENSEIEATLKACEWILEKEIQEENRLQLQEDLTEYNKIIKEGLK